MTQYLISFNDGDMNFPEEELPAVAQAVRRRLSLCPGGLRAPGPAGRLSHAGSQAAYTDENSTIGGISMSWWRTFGIVLVCGLAPTGLDAVMNRSWPDYSALHWLVLLGGFVVIGVGGHVAGSMIARQRSATTGQGVGSGRARS